MIIYAAQFMGGDLAILGGGPMGLAVAHYAHRAGVSFNLFEASGALGGLCRTVQCEGHRYDLGAHRFHDRLPEITRDVKALLPGKLKAVQAPSRVYSDGRFFDFPPTPMNALFSAGLLKSGKIGSDLLKARLFPKKEFSFADFAINAFGKSLAEKFLLNYSEKVWGLPADQLSPDVATKRLSGMSFRSLLAELIFPGKKSVHIDGEFLYPLDGYGEICRALERDLPGNAVKRLHRVIAMDIDAAEIRRIHFQDQESFEPKGLVVSTLPLTLTVASLGEAVDATVAEACKKLRFRSIRLIFLRLCRDRVSENASIYLPDPSICISRIYEPKNRSESMAPKGETSLVVEVPCFTDEAVFSLPIEQLQDRVVAELQGLGLIRSKEVIQWQHRLLPNAYPVYSLDYVSNVKTATSALSKVKNLRLLGRNGLFFYSHLHDQLDMAKEFIRQQ